jgi:hypothetical protein
LPQSARTKIQQHKENQVVSRCAEKWDKRERAAAKGGSVVTPKKGRGRPRNPPAERGSKRKAPPSPAPAAMATTTAGGGEQYVACTYKDGEYKLRGFFSKGQAKDLSGGNFMSSVLLEGSSKHGIRKGLYWFSDAKYKSLVALRNPKDKRWGRPCGNVGRAKGRANSDSDLDTVEEEGEEAGEGEEEDGDEEEEEQTVVQMDKEEEQHSTSAPPAKRNRIERAPPHSSSSSSFSSSSCAAASTVKGGASEKAHLNEALSRAWEQNDFLKDELARSREDNEALRGKAQELAALLRAAQPSSGVIVTPSNAAVVAAEAKEAAASTAMEFVVGEDYLLL